MEPTPEQLEALNGARTRVVACLGQLLGPDFDSKSGYWSDDNFVVDMTTPQDGNGQDVDALIDVYLIQRTPVEGATNGEVDKTAIQVLGSSMFRDGTWLSVLEARGNQAAQDRANGPVVPPPVLPFAPIDDSTILQG